MFFRVFSVFILIGICLVASCDYQRSEGDLEIELINLSKTDTAVVEVSLRSGNREWTTHTGIEDITENRLFVKGIQVGSYYLELRSDDAEGIVRQKSVPVNIEIETATTKTSVLLVEIMYENCNFGELKCGQILDRAIIYVCADRSSLFPQEICEVEENCHDGICIATGEERETASEGDRDEEEELSIEYDTWDDDLEELENPGDVDETEEDFEKDSEPEKEVCDQAENDESELDRLETEEEELIENQEDSEEEESECGPNQVPYDGECWPVELDWDADGVCLSWSCERIEPDRCPVHWNPDNAPSACSVWTPTGGEKKRAIELFVEPSEPSVDEDEDLDFESNSTNDSSRLREPVEIPLVNGLIDSSVAGYWGMDNEQVLDISLHERHAEDVQGVTSVSGVYGNENGALRFDGENGYADISYRKGLCPENALTVAMWVKREEGGSAYTAMLSTMQSGGYALAVHDSGIPVFKFHDGNAYIEVSSTRPLPMGEWTHLAATYNGKILMIYVNGELTGSYHHVGSIAYPFDMRLIIGADPNGYTERVLFFKGAIDEVLVWGRALSPYEIRSYLASGKPYGTSFEPGAKPDFSDVFVTETAFFENETSPVREISDEILTKAEVLGPRPHESTACPIDDEDTSWSEIPFIASREDLCGVLGYWSFDEGTLEDASIHDFDAVNENVVSAHGRFGRANSAFEFSGTDCITVPYDEALNPVDSITLETWVWIENAVNRKMSLISTENSGGYVLLLDNHGYPAFAVNNGHGYVILTQQVILPRWQWSHLAGTYDGNQLNLYVNGVLVGTLLDNEGIHYSSPIEIGLGCNPQTSGVHIEILDGRLDEILIHGVAKSADYFRRRTQPSIPTLRFLANTKTIEDSDWREYSLRWGGLHTRQFPITTSMNGESCYGLLSSCMGYAGYWRFDAEVPGYVIDASTATHDGKLNGVCQFEQSLNGVAMDFSDGCRLIVPDSNGLDLDVFTMESTLKPVQNGNSENIVHKGETGNFNQANYWMTVDTGSMEDSSYGIQCGFSYGADEPLSISIVDQVSSADWNQIACRYDGEELAGFDHSRQTNAVSGSVVPDRNQCTLQIGNLEVSGCEACGFSGKIDRLRLMSRPLEPAEMLHNPPVSIRLGNIE